MEINIVFAWGMLVASIVGALASMITLALVARGDRRRARLAAAEARAIVAREKRG